jgi:hypothetical protein
MILTGLGHWSNGLPAPESQTAIPRQAIDFQITLVLDKTK